MTNGKIDKSEKRNLTVEVIDFFLRIPEAIVYGFDRGEFHRHYQQYGYEQEITCEKLARVIANLKRSGYVEVRKVDGDESIRFTNKARLAAVEQMAARVKNDELYRIVSFDIPEQMRRQRNQFRRFIKRLGFVQIQKSLWVCRKNYGDLVEVAAEEYGVADFVVYIVSDKTNINKFLDDKTSSENLSRS